MARTGISYEEVEQVAEQILQEGQAPTIERIRYELGTGSNSTISKYLNEWKSQRLRTSTTPLPTTHTPSDPVNEAVKRVWQQMIEENEAKIKAIESVTEEKIQHIQLEKEEAIKERERLIDDIQALRDLLKTERQERSSIERDYLHVKQSLAVTQGKLTVLQESFISHIAFSEKLLEEWQQQQAALKNSHQAALNTLQQQHAKTYDDIKAATEEHRYKLFIEIDSHKTEITRLQEQLSQKDKELMQFHRVLADILKGQEKGLTEQAILKQTLQAGWNTLSQSQGEWGDILKSHLEELQYSLDKRLNAQAQERADQQKTLQHQLDLLTKKLHELKAITSA